MINLIISRSQKANTEYVENMINKLNKEKKRVYLVVPQQFTLNTELRLFNSLEDKAILDIKVKSFTTLIREVLSYRGGIKKNSITNSGKNLIMKIALMNVEDSLTKYKGNVEDDGFIEIILEQLNQFKDQGLSSNDLLEIAKEEGGEFEKKLSDISIIYDEYERLLSEKFVDTQEKMEMVNERLGKMDYFKDIIFIFDSFNFMNSLEVEFINELQKLTDVYISLAMDPLLTSDNRLNQLSVKDMDVFRTTNFLFRKIMELDCEVSINSLSYSKNEEIEHLVSNLFSYDVKRKGIKPKNIYIDSYKNTYDEVLNLEIEINKKIQEGYRYKDLMVLITDQQEYEKIIKRVFEGSIPYFIDEQRDIRNLPFSKFVIASLGMIENFNIDDIVVFLKSNFTGINEEDVNNLQIYINSRNIKGSMIFDDKYFILDKKYFTGKKEYVIEELESANIARDIFINIIKDIYKSSRKEKSIRDHAKDFYEFLTQKTIIDNLTLYEEKLKGESNERFEEHKQVWNELINGLDEVVEIAGDMKGDFSLFKDMYLTVISSIKISIIPPSQDQVVVGNLQRTRSSPTKYLYILGMSDLFIPKRSSKRDILNEKDKEKFRQRDYMFSSMNEFSKASESLNLYNSIERAKEIHFSYSKISSDNNGMEKSYLIKQIEKSFNIGTNHFREIKMEDFLYSKSFLKIFVSKELSEKNLTKYNKDKNDFAFRVLEYFKDNPKYKRQYQSILVGLNYTTKKKRLNKDIANNLYYKKEKISSSEIEAFYACPYKHFINYGLRPDIRDSSEVDMLDIGNILHSTLDEVGKEYSRYLKLMEEGNNEALNKPYYRNVSATLDNQKQVLDKNKHIIEMLNMKYREMILNILRQLDESDVSDVRSEVVFGEKGELKGIELNQDGYKFVIEGKVDRIDYFNIDEKEGIRIIDYKSGNQNFDINLCLGGVKIQLIIYLDALSYDEIPLGAFYLPIAVDKRYDEKDMDKIYQQIEDSYKMKGIARLDKNVLIAMDESILDYEKTRKAKNIDLKGRKRALEDKENLLSDNEIRKLISEVENLCINAIRDIRLGEIDTKPYRYNDESPCIYCEYREFCGFDTNIDSEYRFINKVGFDALKGDEKDD